MAKGDAVAVDQYGRQIVVATVSSAPVTASTSVASNASIGTSVGTILALNAARLGATLYNDSAIACLVKLGAAATTTSFTVSLAGSGYYEVPFNYTGIVTGITASGTATIRVVELTA